MAQQRKTTDVATTTKVATKRIKSLEAKSGQILTSLEEAVVRMHHGVGVKQDAALPTNAVTKALESELSEREVDAFVESGRIDGLPEIPVSSTATTTTRKQIVDALKSKS